MDIIIRNYIDSDLDSLNELLADVYGLKREFSTNNNIELVADYNNEIVGYLTINMLYDSVKNVKYCYINYVCVKENYRRCHIATRLLEEVEKICKSENISYIELTSNEKKKEAQELYKSLNYINRDTNVYRKGIL